MMMRCSGLIHISPWADFLRHDIPSVWQSNLLIALKILMVLNVVHLASLLLFNGPSKEMSSSLILSPGDFYLLTYQGELFTD